MGHLKLCRNDGRTQSAPRPNAVFKTLTTTCEFSTANSCRCFEYLIFAREPTEKSERHGRRSERATLLNVDSFRRNARNIVAVNGQNIFAGTKSLHAPRH